MSAQPLKKVVGVGLACQDLLILWRDLSTPLTENQAVDVQWQGGGMTGTALVAVARLGGPAELWAAAGDDRTGDMIVQDLAAEGVDVAHVKRIAGGRGPMVLVCVDQSTGERRFLYSTGLDPDDSADEPLEALADAGCVLVDGFRPASALRAVREARRLGIPVVGDVGGLSGRIERLLPFIDYAIVPEGCARRLDGDFRRACEKLRAMGPGCAVVTLGDRGSVCLSDDGYVHTPAFQLDVVDTTGAGDAFHGAFCFAVVAGLTLSGGLVFASAVGALKCRKLGGRAGLPTLAEVQSFLAERGVELAGPGEDRS
jgi:sugar/nucleoside kinase (ribokinase family)